MERSSQAVLVADEGCYTEARSRAFGAADESFEPIMAGLKSAIEMAEADPAGGLAALWRLQGDWLTLEELEARIGGDPTRATLGLGAAIHAARAELLSPTPHLRERLPEFLDWLGGAAQDYV